MRRMDGKRIVVTRAAHQAAPLIQLLQERGALPIRYPCIAIEPLANSDELDGALKQLHRFDTLALTSANAAHAIASRWRALSIEPDWKKIRIAAVGFATSAAIQREFGRSADFMPETQSGESLARSLPLGAEARILLPQSAIASDAPAEILRSRGAVVEAAIAYRTVCGSGGDDVPGLLAQGRVDALTFVSPSAVVFFAQRCPSAAATKLPAACLGSVTARRASELGFEQIITPETTGAEAMVDALARHFALNEG